MTATDTITTIRTSHADCDHPASKVARAACRRARRSEWHTVTREDVTKGATIRVTTGDDSVEGTLLGWGAKRLIVRDGSDVRVTIAAEDIVSVDSK